MSNTQTKSNTQMKEDRILARGLARELTPEEMDTVGGGQHLGAPSDTWLTVNGDVWVP